MWYNNKPIRLQRCLKLFKIPDKWLLHTVQYVVIQAIKFALKAFSQIKLVQQNTHWLYLLQIWMRNKIQFKQHMGILAHEAKGNKCAFRLFSYIQLSPNIWLPNTKTAEICLCGNSPQHYFQSILSSQVHQFSFIKSELRSLKSNKRKVLQNKLNLLCWFFCTGKTTGLKEWFHIFIFVFLSTNLTATKN